MSHPVDTATRTGFINGLRELADYLAANPGVPVSPHGDCLTVSVNFTEEGGAFQVREAARALAVPVRDETAIGGHYYAVKTFGPLEYRVVSIPAQCMARHLAWSSYSGAVNPDETPAL